MANMSAQTILARQFRNFHKFRNILKYRQYYTQNRFIQYEIDTETIDDILETENEFDEIQYKLFSMKESDHNDNGWGVKLSHVQYNTKQ